MRRADPPRGSGPGPAGPHGCRRAAPGPTPLPGHLRHRLRRRSEQPDAYVLEVDWHDLAGHVIDFKRSARFDAFRKAFADTLSAPTEVFHLQD